MKKLLLERLPLVALSCVIIAAMAYVSVAANYPKIWSAYPMPMVVPLLFDWPMKYVVLIPVAAFILFNIPLIVQSHFEKVPLRLQIITGGTLIFSTLWFILNGKWGVVYQGWVYLISVLLINIALASVLIVLIKRYKKIFKWHYILLIAVLTYIWLFAYAFPYLGELP
ncbi:TPA: hypothetical protein DE059_03215 [Candidatus Peribacteria bacterium]|jgi:hypothetical protein|nr:hypothetical protein [Anaerolineales bacterium]HCI03911.1 hypothetical protein [Candidatus Peribacteria bacterium]|tara:strand:- start:2 stop:505 length:504 start_codon:yes stop_codon:yes gene_type:complete